MTYDDERTPQAEQPWALGDTSSEGEGAVSSPEERARRLLVELEVPLEAGSVDLDWGEVLPVSTESMLRDRWLALRQHLATGSSQASQQRLPPGPSGDSGGVRSAQRKGEREGLSFRRTVSRALDQLLKADLRATVIQPLEERGWDGVAVYAPDPAHTTLRAVAASDCTSVYTLNHSLAVHPGVWPDIEVDIFTKAQAERLVGGGWDPRFNRHLYDTLHHERFLDRLFIPLVLPRNREDCSIHQEVCTWEKKGERWVPSVPAGYQLQTIGNVSVSRYVTGSEDDVRDAIQFCTRVAATRVHNASLAGLLEVVLGELMRRAGAHHGAIHVGSNVGAVFSGDRSVVLRHGAGIRHGVRDTGGVAARPRPEGIGAEAMRLGHAVHLRGDELATRNARLAALGIRSTIAAPLSNGSDECIGVVYLHYRDDQDVPDISDLAEAAGLDIGVALRWEERSLMTEQLLGEAKSFTSPLHESLADRLKRMAHFCWTLVGCDHVSIVAVDAEGNRTVNYAGRHVIDGTERLTGTQRNARLAAILRSIQMPVAMDYVARDAAEAQSERSAFLREQGIQASAVIPLRDDDVLRGALFVDYRSAHNFEREFAPERRLLETLADLFAAGLSIYLGQTANPASLQMDRVGTAVSRLATLQPLLESRVRTQSKADLATRLGITEYSVDWDLKLDEPPTTRRPRQMQ